MRLFLSILLSVSVSVALSAIDFGNRNALQYYPYQEWSVDNPSWSGNAFDAVATVVFTHSGGATQTTEMFYDSGTTWKWRFSASLTGNWSFVTSSSDSSLDGHTGTVSVSANSNPNIKGYITAVGPGNNKWGWSATGDAFTPNYVMYFDDVTSYYNNPGQVSSDIQEFVDGHGFTGFHLAYIAGRWFDYDKADPAVASNAQDPDPRTFEALELVITKTYLAGGATHLWMWGDQSRGQTPINITASGGGINGTVDRRLQRYLAARLGALPGWSLGYGFDLQEWASLSGISSWENYLQSHFGWFHFTGGRYQGPKTGTNHSPGNAWNSALEYASWEHHKPAYSTLVLAADEVAGKPLFTEDRFRIRNQGRSKDFAQDGSDTREFLWRCTMAGGQAAIWGNLWNIGSGGKSDPYPNKTQIKTFSIFFNDNDRFLVNMERANQLTSNNNTWILRTPDNQKFVAYRENANSVQIDLSSASGTLSAIAVNTRNTYQEVDLGNLSATSQTINLPSTSDWAVAIGNFSGGPICSLTASVSSADASCLGESDGSASAIASGGASPYNYSWSNGASSAMASNLTPGNYTVTVTDANACSTTQTITVGVLAAINLSAVTTGISTPGASDGAIDLLVSNGTPPYIYNWSNGETTQNLSGLSEGNYTVTVIDVNGCTTTNSYIVAAGPLNTGWRQNVALLEPIGKAPMTGVLPKACSWNRYRAIIRLAVRPRE